MTAAEDRWSPRLGYTLGFLTLISVFNYLDRSLLGLVLPLIKADLQLSDTALGLISGLAFALFYSLLGVPIASLADRSNRRTIIAVGFGFWSVMTVLTGWVASAWQLAACRFLMGAGEAAGLAPSQSMIGDLFADARRPLALSILTTAGALNAVLFMPIAGWAADTYGWRAAFHGAGLIGVVLALLFFVTVREPARRSEGHAPDSVPMLRAIATLARLPAYLWILAGASFMGGALYASATWTSTLLVRVHGFSITQVAALVTPLAGIGGAIGVVLCGWLADRTGRRDPRWRLLVPAIASLVCVPAMVAFLLGDRSWLWIGGYAVVAVFGVAYQGPVFAAVMTLAPPRMRAVAVAIVLLFTGLVGQIFGPLIVGILNDALAAAHGDGAIRYSLLIVAVCNLLGGLCFWAASRVRDGGA